MILRKYTFQQLIANVKPYAGSRNKHTEEEAKFESYARHWEKAFLLINCMKQTYPQIII